MNEIVWHPGKVGRDRRARVTGGPGATVWLTGLSGSGKSTIAHHLDERLVASGRAAYVLDGDNVRHGLNADLGFSPADRTENVRRVGEVARLMADAGLVVAVPVISPYREGRQRVREAHDAAGLPFLEVWVSTPLDECERRDTKGMYARARAGELPDFTGVDAPYEEPEAADLALDTTILDVEQCVDRIVRSLP
ncbi:MAG TPA: adenylyl-sulfate kinase [Acidimicrobiia bacterium]|nr:adenylyl-sulfate kinase [Acidimicrobiia bacterium]